MQRNLTRPVANLSTQEVQDVFSQVRAGCIDNRSDRVDNMSYGFTQRASGLRYALILLPDGQVLPSTFETYIRLLESRSL
jgi:hypothetical protein